MLKKESILFLLFFAISFQAYGQTERDTLFYKLEPNMIDTASVHEMEMEEPEYFIAVRLKEEYYATFAQLTADNIENFLAVIFEGEYLSPNLPVIKAKISSGRFSLGPYKKQEKAEEVMQQLLKKS